MSIDPTPHLIVPFAQCGGDDWLQAITSLPLNNLGHLLRGMKRIAADQGLPDSLSPPHERVLARALGLPTDTDGLIPWAANEANATAGQAWAFITPCHWAMGREFATLTDPATLGMNEAESRALLADMQPYFATEGITLHFVQPERWRAEGELFRNLPSASLDRVQGRNVDRWLPASKAIKLLQNEMQMLLYTHALNDERAAKGQRPVNSFWLSSSGALESPATVNPQVHTASELKQAALANDWAAYAQAWTQLDASLIAPLLGQQQSGQSVRLSLCGESHALTFETTQHGFFTQLKNTFNPQSPVLVLKQL